MIECEYLNYWCEEFSVNNQLANGINKLRKEIKTIETDTMNNRKSLNDYFQFGDCIPFFNVYVLFMYIP
jgi:hypothetical protein